MVGIINYNVLRVYIYNCTIYYAIYLLILIVQCYFSAFYPKIKRFFVFENKTFILRLRESIPKFSMFSNPKRDIFRIQVFKNKTTINPRFQDLEDPSQSETFNPSLINIFSSKKWNIFPTQIFENKSTINFKTSEDPSQNETFLVNI